MFSLWLVGILLASILLLWRRQRATKDPIVETERLSVLRERSRDAHDWSAMGELALAYSKGIGVPKDDQLSDQWVKRSRTAFYDQLVASSVSLLKQEPKNVDAALQGLRAAADGGHARAQLLLGGLLMVGDDIPQDFIESFRWVTRALDSQSDSDTTQQAQTLMALLSAQMTPAQIAQAQERE